MNLRKPHFIIIGAMKSATTSVYYQLKQQPGIYMPELKEPNFFSDDHQFNKGYEWYSNLYNHSLESDLIGEASTHYAKQPDYPHTLERLLSYTPNSKFIYIMRHPIDRLISQYIHEWTENEIKVNINDAIHKHDSLIKYSLYDYQITPFLRKFGHNNVLPLFFEAIKSEPQKQLEKICEFIGYKRSPVWSHIKVMNKSNERIRKFPFYDILVEKPFAQRIRHTLIPQKIRNKIKTKLQMQERPLLSVTNETYLKNTFNEDLIKLGSKLGYDLNVDNFKDKVLQYQNNWIGLSNK